MKLIPKTKAPDLTVKRIVGEDWSLADQEPENFLMLVFYRGRHCPICKTYLENLNTLLDDAADRGVKVFAVSGDTQERAEACLGDWEVDDLEIGYGMTPEQMREWGLYISKAIKEEEPEVFGEPALFLIRPDQTIYYIAYNSMPMGRPDPKDILEFVDFALKKDYPARGES
ncbi:peroxiredoxin-like family protein [Haloferula chungangensis]|uniref:Peroxiredoxin-like family protein n=1 Tax=Haloferula chungangensis TaxID=1048331 RepID=A0ABW2L718_9BACT